MNDFAIGDKVITTWAPQHGIYGYIIGFGCIIDVDEKLYPCCIVKLPAVLEAEEKKPYRAVQVAVLRLDRIQKMEN